jgi:hypothetical protein
MLLGEALVKEKPKSVVHNYDARDAVNLEADTM